MGIELSRNVLMRNNSKETKQLGICYWDLEDLFTESYLGFKLQGA